MKRVAVCIALVGSLAIQCANAQRKEFKETIKKELSYEGSVEERMLEVQNLNGSITVEGYEGNTVLVSVEKTISAGSTTNLELGKKEIGIKVINQGDKIIVYPDVPNMHYRDGRFTNIDCNRWEESPYEHTLNFKVKMPRRTNLKVGAINDGEVLVKNTRGSHIEANNINGGIDLLEVAGQTKVHCINGEVNISYADNPTSTSTYYSLNGDINITYQKDLSADIAFKSMNGELFTDFDITKQYAKTTKNESGQKKNAKYKYESKPVVQIGNGGLSFDFETLNGNVILKKI
ncbi:DUF4097 family beta strand repeat-containing protein [Maribacter sp. 2307UL18-2]|uniref:DUF4097 family beta strand repeat-containing protein n=1 Tax=Maribacter sp. 2307UL18-2 TaxID=3386274 RepID=UPI0039BD0F6B